MPVRRNQTAKERSLKPPAWIIHPGEILEEEFLKPLKLSGYGLAKAIHVAPQVINDIVLQRRGISPENALRLARFFSTTPEFWMNLQNSYELGTARKVLKKRSGRFVRAPSPKSD